MNSIKFEAKYGEILSEFREAFNSQSSLNRLDNFALVYSKLVLILIEFCSQFLLTKRKD